MHYTISLVKKSRQMQSVDSDEFKEVTLLYMRLQCLKKSKEILRHDLAKLDYNIHQGQKKVKIIRNAIYLIPQINVVFHSRRFFDDLFLCVCIICKCKLIVMN